MFIGKLSKSFRLCNIILFVTGLMFLMVPRINNIFVIFANKTAEKIIKIFPFKIQLERENVWEQSKLKIQQQPAYQYERNSEQIKKFGKLTKEEFFRKQAVIINPIRYDVILKPKKLCNGDVYGVIMVHSHFDNFKSRNAIRSTWGSITDKNLFWPGFGPINYNVALYFTFGLHKTRHQNDGIHVENEKYGDIVQGNFIDTYKNLTLKSLIDLKFISEFCGSAKFFIKSDDDVFLNLPFLLKEMGKMPKRSIMGALCIDWEVQRAGKWAVTEKDFPFKTYPLFEIGSAYIITRDLWEEIYNTSFYVPYISNEDVYITGILGKILNVTHVEINKFSYEFTIIRDYCDFKTNKMYSATSLTSMKITDIWRSLSKLKCNGDQSQK